jgi:biopolymer transport protein TolR
MTLPEAVNTTDKPDTQDQTVVYIDALGKLYINQIEIASADAPGRLLTIMENKTDRTVYLKGDTDAPYGAIMQMMDALREAGIDSVGLITERPNATMGAAGGN